MTGHLKTFDISVVTSGGGLNGQADAILRARADAKRELPVIVVTADTAVDLREQCLAGGADDVILKPVAMNMLLKAMSRMLAKQSDGVMLS